MQLTENFRQALNDYIFFLEKKYPEKTILELVSTRYALNHFERSILYRGIATQETAEYRKRKIITIEQLNKRTLHIDLFNVLFTIASYLRGYPVYLSTDGLLRDASESHGKGEWKVHLEKGLDLLISFLVQLKVKTIIFYIDNLLENGQDIIKKLKAIVEQSKIIIEIITATSPDHLIREAKEGIIATSDSAIIDKSILFIIDLPATVLQFHFQPKIINLDKL